MSAVGGLYLAAAVVIDPRAYFGPGLFAPVTLDSRAQKIRLFRRFNEERPVEGVMVGSSRSMLLPPERLTVLTGRRFFNFCVDSARTEDYLAIYLLMRQRGVKLGALVIGLDVEALHDDNLFDQRLERNPELMNALADRAPGGWGRRLARGFSTITEVFSRQHAQDMLRSARSVWRPRRASQTFDADGLLRYVQYDEERKKGTFHLDQKLVASREEYRRRFLEMKGLSALRQDYLETLLRMAKEDQVSVVLWITPLHSDLAAYLEQETGYRRLLAATRTHVQQLEHRYGVRALDLSDPSLFEGDRAQWYDGAHVDAGNAERIVKRIAGALR